MSLQIFGQLKCSSLTCGEYLHYHSSFFENAEIAIDRTLREFIGRRRDLCCHERM